MNEKYFVQHKILSYKIDKNAQNVKNKFFLMGIKKTPYFMNLIKIFL